VLSQIVNPYLELGAEYVLEIVYNISMLMILSLGLLNYFYKNNRKAFYILIGALCIVFAEVINIAYMYVSHQNLLNFLTISLGLVGFYFLYAQAKLKYEKQDEISF
jgi:predicted membrane protein